MISFGFKRSCPSLGSPSAAYPVCPFRWKWGGITKWVGHRSEEGGHHYDGRPKVPHFPSKPRPNCVVIAPHFPSESVPHFARNPQIDRIHQYFEEINAAPVVFRWKYKMDETVIV